MMSLCKADSTMSKFMQIRYHTIYRAIRIKTKLTFFCQQMSSRYCDWDVPWWSDLNWSDTLHFVFKHHTLVWKSVALSFWLDSLKKTFKKLCFPGNSSCVEHVHFLHSFLFQPDCDYSLEGQVTLTASLCYLWFYSWKSKCFIHHQKAFIKPHIKKVKRREEVHLGLSYCPRHHRQSLQSFLRALLCFWWMPV